MELDSCFTCSQPIFPTTGKTQLRCGHTFHPDCVHSFYKGNSRCPVCPLDHTPLLDFGDNVHIANATRELVYATAQTNANNQRGAFSWLTDKLKSKGSYPALCGPDELVQWKAPISEFIARKITAQNLAESGVKLWIWFNNGYTLSDLRNIGVDWESFVYMGFGPQTLKYVPASFLVDVLKVDISHLMQVGITHEHLAQSGFGKQELLALKCTTHSLINMGMKAEQMRTFKMTEEEWKILALTE